MSLQILIAHTGERLSATPVHHGSLEAFKSWLADSTGIAPSNQILLTSNGKQAKFQALCSEAEVFVYNRQLISSSSADKNLLQTYNPRSVNPLAPLPVVQSNSQTLQVWRELFSSRQTWAQDVVQKSITISKEFQMHFAALETMERGLGVAIGNLEGHVRALEQRYHEAKKWSEDAIEDQNQLVESAQLIVDQLQLLPAHATFRDFFPAFDFAGVPSAQTLEESGTKLDGFAPEASMQKAVSDVDAIRNSMLEKVQKLGKSVKAVASDANNLVADVGRHSTDSLANLGNDAKQLLEEIEVTARRVSSDAEHVQSLPPGERSVSQAARTAASHTRERLPALEQYFEEMKNILAHVVEQRSASAQRSVDTMQRIAAIEANFASVNSKVVDLDVPSDGAEALDYLSLVSQLPYVYGALLIEIVRRREWSAKIKDESTTLVKDLEGLREEEGKRRRKWLKNVGHLVREDLGSAAALEYEVNFKGESEQWPQVERNDISEYLHALRSLGSAADVIEELAEAAKNLDQPARPSTKLSKAFKRGSLQDAAGTRISSFLRDSDEVRNLKESNSKLEEDLKGQRSRVRKLEDLLYKQGQAARSNSGNILQIPGGSQTEVATLKTEEPLSRKASTNFRRTSQNWSGDEKNFARRIVTLEAELLEERQKRQDLEKSRQARHDDSDRFKSEMEEAHSTKRDLMENMEAQQREFASERRLLEDELRTLKQKLEEMEDDYDRIVGSRDNEKTAVDERQHALESEVERTRSELASLKEELDDREHDQVKSLQAILANLDPDSQMPSSIGDLLNSLDEGSERISRRLRELTQNVSAANTEKHTLRSTIKRQHLELVAAEAAAQASEKQIADARGELADQTAKADSIASELEDARHQLRDLRAKFAEGETGSEALRERLEEQAAKAGDLSTQLAQEKSHVNSLDMELVALQKRHQKLVLTAHATNDRLDKRSTNDRELTTRLVNHYEALIRLLESLGLSMTRRDGTLFIQRTSKLASASTTLTDLGASTTFHQPFELSPDPEVLAWMNSTSSEDEDARFGKLIQTFDTFNMNTFAEAVIKLRRDVEWTGKKWKMEARNYRDKYHRAQSEANEKIAYRTFKEGDLALFLPTRNQATRPWAAFNVGAPHYFLRERETHRLKSREWLVARISKVEERVVDLSRTMGDSLKGDSKSEGGMSTEDDNPFELSDGLRWYMLDAAEEKIGAPTTPGLGKSTVASAHVDVKGSIERKKLPAGKDASAKLNKSLESRRSSSNSKRGSISGGISGRDLTSEGLNIGVMDGEVASPSQHMRPSSQSSGKQNSGIGLEIGPGGKPTSDEHLRLEAAGSPSRGFMGFFGSSPQKNWRSHRQVSAMSPPRLATDLQKASSTLSTTTKPAPLRPSPSRNLSGGLSPSRSLQSSRTANESPSKSKSTWEPVWALDLGSEDKGKGRK